MDPYHRILSDSGQKDEDLYPPPNPPFPFPPLPPTSDAGHGSQSHITNYVLVAASLLAAAFLLSFTFCTVLRRRRIRRSLVSASFASTQGADGSGGGGGAFFENDGDDGIHHVWYIRTVGLDEATIGSIAVTEYKAGAGLLGAADCSVCLGEFQDGELVRLLPKCGHAFHISCIDTWLRSHVNCPLCRAHIVEPAGEAAPSDSSTFIVGSPIRELGSSPPLAYSETEGQTGILGGEQNTGAEISIDQFGLPDLSGGSSGMRDSSDLGDAGLQPVRRSVSMDSPFMVLEERINENEKEPNSQEEENFNNKEKHGNSSKVASTQLGHLDIERSLSGGRAFFFSRHGRARSSILPL
ncbi:RING-H2 finger protein ATL52-like [Typha latifolia]|uniref:RING-H2 finger protein ATL52-like n=1 Tax=Typha latifolia TaxID=4733 RepID=UPI003C2BB79F